MLCRTFWTTPRNNNLLTMRNRRWSAVLYRAQGKPGSPVDDLVRAPSLGGKPVLAPGPPHRSRRRRKRSNGKMPAFLPFLPIVHCKWRAAQTAISNHKLPVLNTSPPHRTRPARLGTPPCTPPGSNIFLRLAVVNATSGARTYSSCCRPRSARIGPPSPNPARSMDSCPASPPRFFFIVLKKAMTLFCAWSASVV